MRWGRLALVNVRNNGNRKNGSTTAGGNDDEFVIAALASALVSTVAVAQSASDKSVVRLDPALDALVSPDAKVELVKGGFGFTEGPVWKQEGKNGYLLFTDIPGNVVWKLTAGRQSVGLCSRMPATTGRRCGAGAASRTTASTAPIRNSRNSP